MQQQFNATVATGTMPLWSSLDLAQVEMRKGRNKLALLFGGFLLLLVGGLLVLLEGWLVHMKKEVKEAKNFCETLVPQIQQYYVETGGYPSEANPVWWAGRTVPSLIRTQDFYFSRDRSMFLLRFRDPSAFMDDIWGFDSRWMGWLNYDGY